MKKHHKRVFLLLCCLAAVLITVTPIMGQDPGAPIPVDQLEVISVQTTDVIAGPARTSAFLAPSGETLAHIADELCLYSTSSGEQKQCIPLSEDVVGRIDNEHVRWSPDGRYLVLGEEMLYSMRDPDLLVVDTETGRLTNLTDDEYDGEVVEQEVESTVWIDRSPRWTPDGHILFLRTIQEGFDLSPTYLYRIAPDGTGLAQLAALSGEPFQVSWFNISADGSAIAYSETRADDDTSWLYLSDLDGGHTKPLVQSDFPFLNATFSPNGRYLLTNDARAGVLMPRLDDPAASPMRIVDLNTKSLMLVDDTLYVQDAGWAPSGHGLIYLTRTISDQDTEGLFLTAEPGQSGHPILEGRFYSPTSRQFPPIPWGANNVVLLTSIEDHYLRVIKLGGLTTGVDSQQVPRIELTLHVDVSALTYSSHTRAGIGTLVRNQLESEDYPVTAVGGLANNRLTVVMSFDEAVEVNSLPSLFDDPLLLIDPAADPAVLLEFVDFSSIASGQISEGTCLLTSARVAQVVSELADTEDVPPYEDYTCPPEEDTGAPDSVQLQADGTPFRTVMTGAGISSAVAEPSAWDLQTWTISFSLAQESPEVAMLLDYVGSNPNRPMAIVLDGRLISYPTIQPDLAQKARDGEMDGGVITGQFTRYEARLLAAQLQGGAVPVPVTLERIEIVFVE